MTSDALRVPAGKESRGRNDGCCFGVTRATRLERLLGRGVLVAWQVAQVSTSDFPLRRMAGRDVLVAIGAGRRLRRALVGLVTGQTGLRRVRQHRSELALLQSVATLAVSWLVALHAHGELAHAPVDRNARRIFSNASSWRVPSSVKAWQVVHTALVSGPKRVAASAAACWMWPLFRVTRRAAIRRHSAQLIGGRSVTTDARDLCSST